MTTAYYYKGLITVVKVFYCNSGGKKIYGTGAALNTLEWAEKLVLPPGLPFQPGLMFMGKVRSLL
jgi:hypothetical protein